MSLSCNYHEGMFAHEPLGDYEQYAFLCEVEATCYHEASHAVVGYLLGEALASVGVYADVDGDTVAYGGLVEHKGSQTARIWFNYRPLHFRHGLSAAAGPAGERRFRHEMGIPMRMLGATEDDHIVIDRIGKAIAQRGRCAFAYRRLVWGWAQRLVVRDDVWAAVTAIAKELNWQSQCEIDLDVDGRQWVYVKPSEVYAACRKAGLRRGQLRA